jgi:hypothetical protein
MKVGDPFTITLSKENYGIEGNTCPFIKFEYIKSRNDPFTKSIWENKRLIVKVFKTWDRDPDPGMSNWGWTCTCVRVSKWLLIRKIQILYYKIKYHERNSNRNK